jgi:hypothetical protein
MLDGGFGGKGINLLAEKGGAPVEKKPDLKQKPVGDLPGREMAEGVEIEQESLPLDAKRIAHSA